MTLNEIAKLVETKGSLLIKEPSGDVGAFISQLAAIGLRAEKVMIDGAARALDLTPIPGFE